MNKIFLIFAGVIFLTVAWMFLSGGGKEPTREINDPLGIGEPAVTREVLLYYYNPDNDKDGFGNIICSRAGLAPVARRIVSTVTPVQDALYLLLKGAITESEKTSGVSTEFPLPGLVLKGVNLKEGILTVEFSDPGNKTSGGSCRAAILWFQIEATAKQFNEVKEVRFIPETLFQP